MDPSEAIRTAPVTVKIWSSLQPARFFGGAWDNQEWDAKQVVASSNLAGPATTFREENRPEFDIRLCKALKGRGVQSGIRIIYAFSHGTKMVEFIEIYFKGDKKNEDKQRIDEYLASIGDES